MNGTQIPVWGWVAIGVLVLVQLSLQVWSVMDLFKRDRGPLKGMKLVWLIVIVLGEIVGAVIYIAVGRGMVGPKEVAEQGAAPAADRAQAAVDTLYGPGKSDS